MNDEPLLIDLRSPDASDTEQIISNGTDGKRNAWNLIFGNAKGSTHVSMGIRDRKCEIQRVSNDDNNSLQK